MYLSKTICIITTNATLVKPYLPFLILFCRISWIPVFSQVEPIDTKRGTIKVKKNTPNNKYIISKATSLKIPQERTFRVRAFNYNFKEYFPKEYNSDLFPLVYNLTGLLLVNENKQDVGAEIIYFEYEVVKSNVIIYKGIANEYNITQSIRRVSKMMVGSCLWIKNLSYVDKNGLVHNNKIGEFKIEKVK